MVHWSAPRWRGQSSRWCSAVAEKRISSPSRSRSGRLVISRSWSAPKSHGRGVPSSERAPHTASRSNDIVRRLESLARALPQIISAVRALVSADKTATSFPLAARWETTTPIIHAVTRLFGGRVRRVSSRARSASSSVRAQRCSSRISTARYHNATSGATVAAASSLLLAAARASAMLRRRSGRTRNCERGAPATSAASAWPSSRRMCR